MRPDSAIKSPKAKGLHNYHTFITAYTGGCKYRGSVPVRHCPWVMGIIQSVNVETGKDSHVLRLVSGIIVT